MPDRNSKINQQSLSNKSKPMGHVKQEGKSSAVFAKSEEKLKALHSVITKLRITELQQGHCFMFFSDDLPEDQAYYEYPDGTLKVEKLDKDNIDVPRLIVKILSKDEGDLVKEKHLVFA